MIKKVIPVLILTAMLLHGAAFAPAADAQSGSLKSVGDGINKAKEVAKEGGLVIGGEGDLQDGALSAITAIINILLRIAAVLALLALIIGGIMYILSFGNENTAARAKKVILYAIIGLFIVGLSFLILAFVQYTLTSIGSGSGGGE